MKKIWEKIDAWLKANQDKLLHCAVFGWLVSLGLMFGPLVGGIVFAVLLVLSVIKEAKLDNAPDWGDLWWGMIGGIISLLVQVISNWIV